MEKGVGVGVSQAEEAPTRALRLKSRKPPAHTPTPGLPLLSGQTSSLDLWWGRGRGKFSHETSSAPTTLLSRDCITSVS